MCDGGIADAWNEGCLSASVVKSCTLSSCECLYQLQAILEFVADNREHLPVISLEPSRQTICDAIGYWILIVGVEDYG